MSSYLHGFSLSNAASFFLGDFFSWNVLINSNHQSIFDICWNDFNYIFFNMHSSMLFTKQFLIFLNKRVVKLNMLLIVWCLDSITNWILSLFLLLCWNLILLVSTCAPRWTILIIGFLLIILCLIIRELACKGETNLENCLKTDRDALTHFKNGLKSSNNWLSS